jgi:4-hydroxy-tetrahydrodipicolinate synthase
MISGSLVALATPMLADGTLDWVRLDNLVDFHVHNGTDAIVAVGTTGESATLNPEEHCAVLSRVMKRADGRIAVIAGTGANSTSEAIELTEAAKKIGVDACLLVTPYYNKPTQEGLYQHYKKIAETVDIPQILYNVPGRTAVDMSNETVSRLSFIPNIKGIKDATGNLDRGEKLIQMVGSDIAVYSGDDATAVELILKGAKGNISVTANVEPKLMAMMCKLALDGKSNEARKLNNQLMALHQALFLESNPIPVKYALYKMGLIDIGIRLPLTMLDTRFHAQLENALSDIGAL